MLDYFKAWFQRNFSNPQVIILSALLLLGFLVVIFMGQMLAPFLASIVVAYLLESLVALLRRCGSPRMLAVNVVFIGFLAILIFLTVGLIPLLSSQLSQLLHDLPTMVSKGQQLLLQLPQEYPQFVSEQQVVEIMAVIRSEISALGQQIVSLSLASIVGVLTIVVYLILVPLMVFFFLKDKMEILNWFRHWLPANRSLATSVWHEMDVQIGNYVRGKIIEIFVVGVASYIFFALMGLNYAILLAVLVGLSVIIPYIGAVVVTVPVLLIAFLQWGWGTEFRYLVLGYLIIQALDGNVLVPLLFSEAVNLHPVAIIVSVLVFGGLWGFWGVFFAIPLATLVKAVINAWPREEPDLDEVAARG